MEVAAPTRWSIQTRLIALAITLGLIILVTLLVPLERTLGAGLRLVYFHGAWVWAGLITFGMAALSGLVALLARRGSWSAWSLALGRAGLFFWLTYLPLSLLVMQVFWGGLFLDEPRWRIPLAFGIIGVLLQVGLYLLNMPWLVSLGNFVFGGALIWSLSRAQNVLHPDSPVFTSDSTGLKVYFVILVVLSLLLSAQLAIWLKELFKDRF